MTEYQKMQNGMLFNSLDSELCTYASRCQMSLATIRTKPSQQGQQLLRSIVKLGEHTFVVVPVHFDYGFNVKIGNCSFINVNCVFLDVGKITIGDNTMIGPACQFYAVNHLVDPKERLSKPGMLQPTNIHIGNNVWVGGNVTFIGKPAPYALIVGDNSVIAAGSVIVEDVPANVMVAGNTAKIIKQL